LKTSCGNVTAYTYKEILQLCKFFKEQTHKTRRRKKTGKNGENFFQAKKIEFGAVDDSSKRNEFICFLF